MNESFYVFSKSTDLKNIHEQNSGANFRVDLPETKFLNGEEYEVALMEITFDKPITIRSDVILLLDIVKESVCSGRNLRLLRRIPFQCYRYWNYIIYQKPLYMPITHTKISTFSITMLEEETLNQIPINREPISVLLHFRPKK